jgi:hypothetical protein
MTQSRVDSELIERLSTELTRPAAEQLVLRLKPDDRAGVLALLEELKDLSAKAAAAAMEALVELERRADLAPAVAWLDVGVALAQASGATALKYFRDSPLILGLIDGPDARTTVLTLAVELAEEDANVALEFLRTAPQTLTAVPADQLRRWLEIGVELTRVDVVVGLEYIRQIPGLAPVLPLESVRDWLSFGLKLIRPNSLGKPDYIGTLEFLRTSAALLGDIEQVSIRRRVVEIGSQLADHAAEAGIACLAESPRLMRLLPALEWQTKVLQYGSLLAERDAEATLSYLRRCPEIIAMIGAGPDAAARFERWFTAGMEILAYSPEGARAYFAVESQRALASVEAALSGVPLRTLARTIKLFVEGLCGTDVSIAAVPDGETPATRATVSADGRTICLPALLRRYPSASENERLYLVMAAHEAGHLEFGTYRPLSNVLDDLAAAVRHRYGRAGQVGSVADLVSLYPHRQLVRDLWTVLEDARVEFLLQEAYPGLRRDLAKLAADVIVPRDPAAGLTAKELIVDCLLRLSTGEPASTAVPRAVQAEVSELWALCRDILRSDATAEDTLRLTDRVYVRLEVLLAPKADMIAATAAQDAPQEAGVGSAGSDSSEPYRPLTNWVHRGDMHPEFISRHEPAAGDSADSAGTASHGGGSKEGAAPPQAGQPGGRESGSGDVLGGGRALPSVAEEVLRLEVEDRTSSGVTGERAVRYPEWDHTIADYRLRWCRVVERQADSGRDEPVARVLEAQRSVVRSLRRHFEALRPPALRRAAGQADGDEIDLDAAVRRVAEQRAGEEGGDRVYVRREKKERDVAVAFLVDVSGSTGRQIDQGRRVIDIERDSLVVLCEALDAVGDQYALFAYSGQGRGLVEFLVVKEFDERLGPSTAGRLGGLAPRQQNRDGAAIRHACTKLLRRPAKTRLLVLLSDGRPLDGDYKDEYSLEDTKAALREARQAGVESWCVTIDSTADGYLRRMYGDVHFTVIDRVETLPAKLPRLYQRMTA